MLGAGGSGISQFLCWHILPKDLEPPSPPSAAFGASGSWELLLSHILSRLTWERDQSMQSSGCSQALSVSCWHHGCRSDIPCKTLWKHHCQELFLGLHISLCVQSFVGGLPCQQKLGWSKRRGSQGAGKESRKREKVQGPFRRNKSGINHT